MAHAYRPDIDGLRAVAVVAVLGFHAFPDALPGGFTGVDIFFVISGFLISGIILGELKAETFTFGQFYARRVRRIFPALALVLTATLLLGWLCLSPYEYEQLGGHVAAGAGFVSNLLLFHESGYFDTDSALKPLLHLWSLGVEEQYYLLWPLLLFALRRHIHSIFWLILGVAATSFVLNILLVHRQPGAAFYLPATRFWELMIGSIAAYRDLYSARRFEMSAPVRNITAAAGIALLALTLVLVHDGQGFPGWRALLPTAGAILLIQAGPQAWINRNLLGNRAVVYVGLISYPLYLWHWPLLAYARILHGGLPPASVRIGALVLGVILAWATYELVEKRIRRLGRSPLAVRTAGLAGAAVGVLGALGLLAVGSILQSRSSSIPYLTEISAAYDDWHVHDLGTIAGNTRGTVLFLGDSHMQQFWPRLEFLTSDTDVRHHTVLFRTRGGCAPIPGIERLGYGCAQFVERSYALAHQPEIQTVVISASWVGFTDRKDYYKAGEEDGEPLTMLTPQTQWVMDGFESAVAGLVAAGKHVVIVLSSPYGKQFDPREMAQRDGWTFRVHLPAPVSRQEIDSDSAYIDDRLIEIARRTGASVLDPLDSICDSHVCPTLDARGKPLLKDDSHLRSSYVRSNFTAFDHLVIVPSAAANSVARSAPENNQ
jgi:peptidoglycan/LPS O-acetylase OafA/YrhL